MILDRPETGWLRANNSHRKKRPAYLPSCQLIPVIKYYRTILISVRQSTRMRWILKLYRRWIRDWPSHFTIALFCSSKWKRRCRRVVERLRRRSIDNEARLLVSTSLGFLRATAVAVVGDGCGNVQQYAYAASPCAKTTLWTHPLAMASAMTHWRLVVRHTAPFPFSQHSHELGVIFSLANYIIIIIIQQTSARQR